MAPLKPLPPQVAERIGPYRILQVLGEGGMGVVYEAEETGPVRRRVALKVLRDPHAPREVLARFEVERQALAVMNHPCIAKVLQAGTTESGQPYFAMELVRGIPITQYCDEHRLSVRQRLTLFVDVCHAVQHAHQKGLIHRDLKPSNILVTEADGLPEPRIIDFGIAKAVGQQLTEMTLVTQFGQAMGTAAYMSPEQAESSGIDVDTRSDIYSLGVLLYEILVGHLPVDPASVGLHVYLARLMARETNPLTPSARLGSDGVDPAIIAMARHTDVPHLRRELAGDLDWIVMKAMDGDRSRRYATANGLAMDIQRHLRDEPIVARPPSKSYQVGKFIRRHRAGTIFAALALAAIVASAALTTVGMLRATRAERIAAEEAAAATQVTDFLVDLFRISSPSEARGNSVTARELLDRGAERARTDLAGQPVLQSRLLHTIGTVYGSLGLYADARPILETALRARESAFGGSDSLVARTLHELGLVATGRGDYADADRFLQRSLDIRAAGHAPPGDVANSLTALAILRVRQGRLAAAESLYRRSIPIQEALPQPDDALLARNLTGLAVVYYSLQRPADGEPLLRRALALQERTFGPGHLEVGIALNNLGGLNWELRQYQAARDFLERARAIFRNTLPEVHPHIASNTNNLAETYWKLGQLADAERLFGEALSVQERLLNATHPSIATTLNGLAGLLRDQRRYAEAEPRYRRALAIREQAFGAGHADVAETRRDYAVLLRATGRADQAAAMEQP